MSALLSLPNLISVRNLVYKNRQHWNSLVKATIVCYDYQICHNAITNEDSPIPKPTPRPILSDWDRELPSALFGMNTYTILLSVCEFEFEELLVAAWLGAVVTRVAVVRSDVVSAIIGVLGLAPEAEFKYNQQIFDCKDRVLSIYQALWMVP